MKRNTRVLMIAFAVMSILGCGQDLVGPTPPPPPPVTITSIVVSCEATVLLVGTKKNCSATAGRSDGSRVDVSSSATWSTSQPAVATVAAGGMVTAVGPGTSQITVSFGNVTGALRLDVMPLPVVLVSLSIGKDTTMQAGTAKQFAAVAKYSDDHTENVTSSAVWTTSLDFQVVVDSGGMVHAVRRGSPQITASYQGFFGTVTVTVVGTPRSQLPPISQQGWDLVMSWRSGDGSILRAANGVATVWAPAGIKRVLLDSVVVVWKALTNGVLIPTVIADSAMAQFRYYLDPTITGEVCGFGYPGTSWSRYNVITGGQMEIRPGGCVTASILAHEFGHAIGVGHTPQIGFTPESGVDFMAPAPVVLQTSPLLVEVVRWLYSVPSGTIPIG